jgi:sulfonate transport system substrate-binding protein
MTTNTGLKPKGKVRRALLAGLAVSLAGAIGWQTHAAHAATATEKPPAELRVDYAYYSPESLVIKHFGWLEDEFRPDHTTVRWVLSLGSNRALEFLNSNSADFGSTAGLSAVLARANGNPIKAVYIYSRPEWTALVVPKDSPIHTVADLKGKKIAATTGTDPFLFTLRALQTAGLTRNDVQIANLQHPDGRTALQRGQVDAWAGLDPYMAASQLQDGDRLLYRNVAFNTYGFLNVNETFLREHPETVGRVIRVYEKARVWIGAHPDEAAQIVAQASQLPLNVVQLQLQRNDFSHPLPSQTQIDALKAAAPILKEASLVRPGVDVDAAIDQLVDTRFAQPYLASP